jgi:hypothetical protein
VKVETVKPGAGKSKSIAENRVIWLVPTHLPRLPVFKTMLASLVEFTEDIESAVIFTYQVEAAAFEAAGCVADTVIVLEDFFYSQGNSGLR